MTDILHPKTKQYTHWLQSQLYDLKNMQFMSVLWQNAYFNNIIYNNYNVGGAVASHGNDLLPTGLSTYTT